MFKEKIKSDRELESSLELLEKAEGFDTAGQEFLQNIKVLSYILKYATTEFADMYVKVKNPKLSHGTVKIYLHIDI